MGYTHYWDVADNISDEKWNMFKLGVSAIIALADGKRLRNSASGERSKVVICNGRGEAGTTADITDKYIAFNGKDENRHETFYVERNGKPGFNFCKTARKPYDPVVVACQILGRELGIFSNINSDGDYNERLAGKRLYKNSVEFLKNQKKMLTLMT